jgi:hypothetical protein
MNFFIGAGSCFGIAEYQNTGDFSNVEQLINVPTNSLANCYDWSEVLKVLISIFGGLLATIVLNFLKAKFPDLFENRKKRRQRRSQENLK